MSTPPTTTSASDTTRCDVLIVNANVLTQAQSPAPQSARVIAITGTRIVAIGGDALAETFAAKRVVDLKGATVLPGFNDTHIHIDGNPKRYVDLTETTSIAQLKDQVTKRAAELGRGEWITGYGWSEDKFAEQRKPTRQDLDNAAPHNPVVLTRAGAHSAVASSRALALARLSDTSADPDNGALERDSRGQLTGIIRERQDLLLGLVPAAPEEELRASLAANLHALFAHGITSITQASATPQTIERWRKVYAERQKALPRAAVQLLWPGKQKFAAFDGVSGDGDEYFRLGPLKLFVDGGFTGPAAYTKTPYRGESSYRGKLALSDAELRERIRIAHRAGWQLGIHAIGDAAIELTVDALRDTLQTYPRSNHRHYLNHFTVMPGAQTMQTMAAHNIWVTQQPNFTYSLEGRYVAYLDGQRLKTNNALRTPMSHGVFMALSSDILPIGPMIGIYAAVTRRGMSGAVYGAQEALSVDEALAGYTRNAAYFTFEEQEKGTLEVGKLADLVVLDADPRTIDPEQLRGVNVLQTWLGGEQVFQKNATTVR